MRERHIRIARTARYYTLGPVAPDLREIWLVCHGYRQLARRFLPRFTDLDDGTRLIVAPEGLSRFYLHDSEGSHGKEIPIGATWMTREDRENEITDYIGLLDAVLAEVAEDSGREITGLTVLGFSQGAHTACRWMAAGDAAVERLILWGAYLPDDFDLERGPDRLGSTELILVRGLLDHHISEGAHASQKARLEELGIPFKTVTHAGGHELDPGVLRQLAGIAE
jgi:predicted esterase